MEPPPVVPLPALRLADQEGSITITPELAPRYLAELQAFIAGAEPWRLYGRHVDRGIDSVACRCGAESEHPGRDGWKWRKLRPPYYDAAKRATGFARLTEQLCPECQRRYGV